MKQEESRLQQHCVNWFRYQYPKYALLLFAVPNGGFRNEATARRMKAEGVVAGVADLILMLPSAQYHALCIEMKTEKGRQSDKQKEWQAAVEKVGFKYVICHSFQEFFFRGYELFTKNFIILRKITTMRIGERLKMLRLSKGMTLQEAGKALANSRGNMSAIETGRTSPTLDKLARICENYGYKVAIVFVPIEDADAYGSEIYEPQAQDKRFK